MMSMNQPALKNIDEYIAGFPFDVQKILEKVRQTIRKAAPNAEETISYKIPTFTINGRYLIYFTAYKKHVGIYPVPIEDAELKTELTGYVSGKGTAKFLFDKPIPFGLLKKIVKLRVKATLARADIKNR
jgi:uncharacterized protein YdhG (YjbR/CyaY superfamily)